MMTTRLDRGAMAPRLRGGSGRFVQGLKSTHPRCQGDERAVEGGEVRDSTIIEECLEVSRRLQAAGFSPKQVFCTSNKNDYCEKGSRSETQVLLC